MKQLSDYNIILITLDGLRLDKIEQCTYLKLFKEQSFFFKNMVTVSPYTLASMHAIFSGMYPSKNGVNAYYNMFKFKKEQIKYFLQEDIGEYIMIVVLIFIFLSMMIVYRFLEINKINLVVTYFQQCLRILGPHLTVGDRLRLEQAFALLENKEAFEDLIKELNEIAEASGTQLPKAYY